VRRLTFLLLDRHLISSSHWGLLFSESEVPVSLDKKFLSLKLKVLVGLDRHKRIYKLGRLWVSLELCLQQLRDGGLESGQFLY